MERFGLDGPLIGFITDASVIPDGGVVAISTWAHAVAEPELAVYLGEDLHAGAGEEETRAAISAIGPAIELADIDPPPDDVEEILAGNIFHRGVVVGEANPARPGADLTGLEARVRVNGVEAVATTRLEDLTGRLIVVVSHLSHLLADHGEMIRAGELIICGSIVPPLTLAAPATVEFELHPMSPISVSAE
jgi:2-keto-4-pentenoate hydratase